MLFSLLSSAHTRVGKERPVILSCVCGCVCVRMRCASNYMVENVYTEAGATPSLAQALDRHWTLAAAVQQHKRTQEKKRKKNKKTKFSHYFSPFFPQREGSVVVKPREFKNKGYYNNSNVVAAI